MIRAWTELHERYRSVVKFVFVPVCSGCQNGPSLAYSPCIFPVAIRPAGLSRRGAHRDVVRRPVSSVRRVERSGCVRKNNPAESLGGAGTVLPGMTCCRLKYRAKHALLLIIITENLFYVKCKKRVDCISPCFAGGSAALVEDLIKEFGDDLPERFGMIQVGHMGGVLDDRLAGVGQLFHHFPSYQPFLYKSFSQRSAASR